MKAREDLLADVTEKEFQQSVLDVARALRWHVYHTYDARRSQPGFPDLVMWRERIVYAELKTMRGKVQAWQRNVLDELRAAGGEVYLWRPTDWDEIRNILA